MSAARAQAHKRGRELLLRGSYGEAARAFEQTLELHGSHVSLRIDLAEAALYAGDDEAFRRHALALEIEFPLARPLLGEASRLSTQLALARFREELAHPAPALRLVESVIGSPNLSATQSLPFHARRLHLLAAGGRPGDFEALLRDCASAARADQARHAEIFPDLLRAEARIDGFERAWSRLLDLAGRVDVFPSDLRRGLADLLEFALETGQRAAADRLLVFRPALGTAMPEAFELELVRYASFSGPAREEDFRRWESLPPMARFRLLALEARNLGTIAAHQRLNSFLESTDEENRKLLIGVFDTIRADWSRAEIPALSRRTFPTIAIYPGRNSNSA